MQVTCFDFFPEPWSGFVWFVVVVAVDVLVVDVPMGVAPAAAEFSGGYVGVAVLFGPVFRGGVGYLGDLGFVVVGLSDQGCSDHVLFQIGVLFRPDPGSGE